MELTKDYIEENELAYGCSSDEFEYVTCAQESYDEGSVVQQHIVREKATGDLWAFAFESNSWAEIYEVGNIYRVEPQEKTITIYVRKKG